MAKSLLQRALGSGANAALDTVRQSIEAMPFAFLRHVDRQNILTYLIDEHPQTIALVMSHLPPSFGAEILTGSARRKAALRGAADRQDGADESRHHPRSGKGARRPHVERDEPELRECRRRRGGGRNAQRGRPGHGAGALGRLAEENPDLVDEIRRLMFVFEDICKFTDKDIQTVLKNIETSQWALALKGASEELTQRILGNLSERAASMLKEEIGYLGSVKRSAVENKQQEIVDIIRRLEDEGQIEINTSGEVEEMVV